MGNCFGFRKTKFQSTTSFPQAVSGDTKASGNFHSSTPLNPKISANAENSVPGGLPTPRTEGDILSSSDIRPFTLSELKNATMNFCPDRIIGEGGFGYIYKGWIDEQALSAATPGNGLVVAIKKLKPEGSQGHREWLSEVNYLSQSHHPNLVKLIGYCLDQENRLLVYEFMPRGSLEDHLFGSGTPPLSWAMRIKVAIGAARGLSFLHDSESQVIYRDFKTSNILLDKEYNAKLSDFGLAKAGPTGDRTHVTTRVIGTQGYAAPEYIATGHLSTRCDVYSFGVVLLELLTGRRAVDKTKSGSEQNLVEWAKPYLGDRRKLFRAMDTRLQGQYSQKGAFMIALLALNCINEAKLRPRMAEVLIVLEDIAAAKPRSASHSEQHVVTPGSSSPLRHSGHSPTNVTPKGRPLPSYRNSKFTENSPER